MKEYEFSLVEMEGTGSILREVCKLRSEKCVQ
jgi:hypothetical protein